MIQTPTPITPEEVELKLKFKVSTQEDKDYLTSTSNPEMTFLYDAAEYFSDLKLECTEVNGVKVPKD